MSKSRADSRLHDETEYRSRAATAARMLRQYGPWDQVFDFGAGHCYLRDYLYDRLGRYPLYLSSDIDPVYSETFKEDYNDPNWLPVDTRAIWSFRSVAVALGLLEWLDEPRFFLEKIRLVEFNAILLSYLTEPRDDPDPGLKNHMTQEGVRTVLQESGYRVVDSQLWGGQTLYFATITLLDE